MGKKKITYQSVQNINGWALGENRRFQNHDGFAVENVEGESFDIVVSSGWRNEEPIKKTRISLDFWNVKNLCSALREARKAYQSKADYIEKAMTEDED